MVFRRNLITFLVATVLLAGCSQKNSKSRQEESCDHIVKEYSNEQKMKIGIILETREPEKAWNAFRFAVATIKQGHKVKVFLMGEAVECDGLVHEKYNVDEQLRAFVEAGGEILACGTCLRSRQLEGSDVCPVSTMADCVEMVEWADKVVTF